MNETRPNTMRPVSRGRALPVPAGWLLAAAVAVFGCRTVSIDLGSNDAGARDADARDAGARDAGGGGGAGGSGSGPAITWTCASPSDDSAPLDPCASTCAEGLGAPYAFSLAADLVAQLYGPWQTCAGGGALPWAPDVMGIDFQPGCTVFLLHDAPDGGAFVRGITPDDQGSFDVLETDQAVLAGRLLRLNLPTWSRIVQITTSRCPHILRFELDGGNAVDFAAVPTPYPPAR